MRYRKSHQIGLIEEDRRLTQPLITQEHRGPGCEVRTPRSRRPLRSIDRPPGGSETRRRAPGANSRWGIPSAFPLQRLQHVRQPSRLRRHHLLLHVSLPLRACPTPGIGSAADATHPPLCLHLADYIVYIGVLAVSFVVAYLYFPETANLTLEESAQLLDDGTTVIGAFEHAAQNERDLMRSESKA